MNRIEISARNELADLAKYFSAQEAKDMRETAESGTLDEVRSAIYAAEAMLEARSAL